MQTAESMAGLAHVSNGPDPNQDRDDSERERHLAHLREVELFGLLREKDKQIAALLARLDEASRVHRVEPEFLDIGWGAFNIEAIEVFGEWAEQNKPGEPIDPIKPRVRVFGESFEVSQEIVWFLRRRFGAVNEDAEQAPTNDKYAAIVNEDSCLNRAGLSEPLFILRAQDQFSAELVREWADRVEVAGGMTDKIEGARLIAGQMEAWAYHKIPD